MTTPQETPTLEQPPAGVEPAQQNGGDTTQRNRYDPTAAGAMASRLTRRDITSGNMADLRRMNPARPNSSTFWRLMLNYRITVPEDPMDDNVAVEQAWAHVLTAIAHGSRVGENETTTPHDPAMPLGRALAIAGYQEARLNALLNAGNGHIQRLTGTAAQFLHSKGLSYNCSDLARLMLSPLRSKAQRDADRTHLARQYHREIYLQSQA